MEVNGNIIRDWFHKIRTKKVVEIVSISTSVLFLILFFLYFIHPWFTILVIPPLGEHRGVKHYTSDKYLAYESGDQFQKYLETIDFGSESQPVDFYHVNHWVRDNPFYGKYFDVFSVDLALDEASYQKVKSEITTSSVYFYDCPEGDFEIWMHADLPNVYLIAFCDEYRIVRCILTTDCDNAHGIVGGFSRHTSLKWEIENK